MKITKSRIRQLINESFDNILKEMSLNSSADFDFNERNKDKNPVYMYLDLYLIMERLSLFRYDGKHDSGYEFERSFPQWEDYKDQLTEQLDVLDNDDRISDDFHPNMSPDGYSKPDPFKIDNLISTVFNHHETDGDRRAAATALGLVFDDFDYGY